MAKIELIGSMMSFWLLCLAYLYVFAIEKSFMWY